eukprot:403363257
MQKLISLTLVTLLSICGITYSKQTPNSLDKQDIALFAEGFFEGILDAKLPDLQSCLTDFEEIGLLLKEAIEDLNQESFSSVKRALHEISEAVHKFPTALHQCKVLEDDLKELLRMAEIFGHPFTLIVHASHNLIVNGVDIYRKIHESIVDYENHDYFDFGKNMGLSINEVFLRNPKIKDSYDEQAYELVMSILKSLTISKQVDEQLVYNYINGYGSMILNPLNYIQQTIRDTSSAYKSIMKNYEMVQSFMRP